MERVRNAASNLWKGERQQSFAREQMRACAWWLREEEGWPWKRWKSRDDRGGGKKDAPVNIFRCRAMKMYSNKRQHQTLQTAASRWAHGGPGTAQNTTVARPPGTTASRPACPRGAPPGVPPWRNTRPGPTASLPFWGSGGPHRPAQAPVAPSTRWPAMLGVGGRAPATGLSNGCPAGSPSRGVLGEGSSREAPAAKLPGCVPNLLAPPPPRGRDGGRLR